jgi:N6-L-threonylcarbamoyladenine synthase
MLVLGIETSCDETAAGVVRNEREVLSNVVYSQLVHRRYGGVVPELASREHLKGIVPVIEEALGQARIRLEEVDGIAVTNGPGLVGSLLVGLMYAKAQAYSLKKPLIGIHHLEGHLFANLLQEPDLTFPLIFLAVSGGHTELILVRGKGDYGNLGGSLDDAAGEAFDKVAKHLGLGYPGGPEIENIGKGGDPNFVKFPRAYLNEGSLDFSFSGIKTAVVYYVQDKTRRFLQDHLADLCASFQEAIIDVLVEKCARALRKTGAKALALGGGVACNRRLREVVSERCRALGVTLSVPEPSLCSDNGAMIALAGGFRFSRGERSPWDITAQARMELAQKGPSRG